MEISKSVCLRTFNWCKQKYGKSRYKKRIPKLVYREKTEGKLNGHNVNGEYDYVYNIIYIYPINISREKEPLLALIFTVIHEYRHFMQNMKNYDMYFDKYSYRYESHPYERTCDRFAKKEQYECYYFIVNRKKFPKKKKKGT